MGKYAFTGAALLGVAGLLTTLASAQEVKQDAKSASGNATISPVTQDQLNKADTSASNFLLTNGNYAQTIQVGNSNAVFQAQVGGNNVSNVGVWGGKNNDVGVFQGGHDLSTINLINTQGLSVAVLQPPGSAPMNVLIARLPDGRLLIKR